jgi:hypothetical protein
MQNLFHRAVLLKNEWESGDIAILISMDGLENVWKKAVGFIRLIRFK